jgi:hypothetical protein
MKKYFRAFLIALLIVPLAVAFSACGKPKDRPYVKSVSLPNVTVVNPTNKSFEVTLHGHVRGTYTYTWRGDTYTLPGGGPIEQEFEIGPNETKVFTMVVPSDSSFTFKGILISREIIAGSTEEQLVMEFALKIKGSWTGTDRNTNQTEMWTFGDTTKNQDGKFVTQFSHTLGSAMPETGIWELMAYNDIFIIRPIDGSVGGRFLVYYNDNDRLGISDNSAELYYNQFTHVSS